LVLVCDNIADLFRHGASEGAAVGGVLVKCDEVEFAYIAQLVLDELHGHGQRRSVVGGFGWGRNRRLCAES
jgi:hypothetical protein